MHDASPEMLSLFCAALERTSAAERAAYLESVCGTDAALRARLEALLRAHEQAASGADPAPRLSTTLDEPFTERPGTMVGPYKLLEQIGEGGFGVVFLAEQFAPVRRKVALKVLKPGMDTRQVVARFEAERQALAIMDHPHIAKVFDGGATPSGRPYFVMELVKGVPITDFCDQNHLSPRQRLELFISVCQAVQHAHQKGIIHRDLKPSNVLVSRHDATPIVKVIDFGVAKALGQELTDKTLFTGFAQMIGTPLYMSPEQAGKSDLDIDTRSDIYSLGVLLYELLTGTTPFTKERFKKAAYDEIRRIIREEEPPKPSTRLSESKEALASLSAQRQVEPGKLAKLVRGELDWIVMKALEKDRNRRYETANGFAMDVQRYLANEAVLACPPSASYQLRTFVRRHKSALVTAAIIAVALFVALGAVAVSIGWNLRDREARQLALDQEIAHALEETQNWYKHDRLFQALETVKRAESLLAAGNTNPELGQCVQQWHQDLSMVLRLDRIRLEQAALKDEWWDHAGADPAYRTAFRDYGIDVLNLDAAVAGARVRASAIRQHLIAALDDWAFVIPPQHKRRREHVRAVIGSADSDGWNNRFRDAILQRDRQALEALAMQPEVNNLPPSTVVLLARGLREVGSVPKAVEVLTAAQRRFPSDFWLNIQLASFLCWDLKPSRTAEAVGYCRVALAIQPDNAPAWVGLGASLDLLEQREEAIFAFRKAIALLPGYAEAHHRLGRALMLKGAYSDAVPSFQEAWRLNPKQVVIHLDLSHIYRSTRAYEKAIVELKAAVRLEPKNVTALRRLAYVLANCPDVRLREPAQALEMANQAVKLAPRDWSSWMVLGSVRFRMRDWPGALAALEKTNELEKAENPYLWIFLAMTYAKQCNPEKARKWYDQTVRYMEYKAEWIDSRPVMKDELPRLRAEAAALLGVEGHPGQGAQNTSPRKP